MRKWLLGLLFALAFVGDPANAQNTVVTTCGVLGQNYAVGSTRQGTVDPTGLGCVNASVSASITGFAPATYGTPLSVISVSTTGALPAGAVVIVNNAGTTNTAYCALGATATLSSQPIPPGGWFAYTVGAATQLSCITSTSTTTVNTTGGAGIPTGAGGGGGSGGGGSNASVSATGAAPPGSATQAGCSVTASATTPADATMAPLNCTTGGQLRIAGSVNTSSATTPVSTMNSASASSGTNSAMAGVFDDTSPTAITENNFGFLRMSTNRNLYGTIRDAAGNERGANVNSSGQLAVAGPVTQGTSPWVTQPVKNQTPSNCSVTITTGGTAQNITTSSATLTGITLMDIDTALTEGIWISFTGTAAPNSAGSFYIPPYSATTGAGSYTSPSNFSFNSNLSVYAATTGHKISCVKW